MTIKNIHLVRPTNDQPIISVTQSKIGHKVVHDCRVQRSTNGLAQREFKLLGFPWTYTDRYSSQISGLELASFMLRIELD